MDISNFEDLVRAARAQSHQSGHHWAIVFVASVPGRAGRPLTSNEADQALQRMIESIKVGSFGAFIPFDRLGQPVLFS